MLDGMSEQRKIEAEREESRRPRPIGPVDRAVRRMSDYVNGRRTSDADAIDFPVKEWMAVDAEMPQHLRPEEVIRESDPERLEQLVMQSNMERRKIEAKRGQSRRPRSIGPVDRAVRRMNDRNRRFS